MAGREWNCGSSSRRLDWTGLRRQRVIMTSLFAIIMLIMGRLCVSVCEWVFVKNGWDGMQLRLLVHCAKLLLFGRSRPQSSITPEFNCCSSCSSSYKTMAASEAFWPGHYFTIFPWFMIYGQTFKVRAMNDCVCINLYDWGFEFILLIPFGLNCWACGYLLSTATDPQQPPMGWRGEWSEKSPLAMEIKWCWCYDQRTTSRLYINSICTQAEMERRRLCSDGRKSNACEILFLQRFPHSHSPFIEIIRDEEGKGREECAATRHGELVFYFLIHIKYQCMMGALLRS